MSKAERALVRALERAAHDALIRASAGSASRRAAAVEAYRKWCLETAADMEDAVRATEVELAKITPMLLPERAAQGLTERVLGSLWGNFWSQSLPEEPPVQSREVGTGVRAAVSAWTRAWMRTHIPRERRKALGEGLRRGVREEEAESATIALGRLERLAGTSAAQWARHAGRPDWLRRRSVRELDPTCAFGEEAIGALIERDVARAKIVFVPRALDARESERVRRRADAWHAVSPPLAVWAALAREGVKIECFTLAWVAACAAVREQLGERRRAVRTGEVREMVAASAQHIEAWRDADVRAGAAWMLSEHSDVRVSERDVERVDQMWWRTRGWPRDYDGERLGEWEDGCYEGHAKGAWSLKVDRPSRALVALGARTVGGIVENIAAHGPAPMVAAFAGMQAMERAKDMGEGESPRIRVPLQTRRRR